MPRLAENEVQWRALCDNSGASPFVHDMKRWKEIRRQRGGILASISDAALDELESSMTFEAGGLAHVKHAKVEQEVGMDGLVKVLGLFGLGPELIPDHVGHICDGDGCFPFPGSTYTSNCGKDT